MLRSIRECITNLPQKNFDEFYQDYITQIQDSIIEHEVVQTYSKLDQMEDELTIIEGLNELTEELKRI